MTKRFYAITVPIILIFVIFYVFVVVFLKYDNDKINIDVNIGGPSYAPDQRAFMELLMYDTDDYVSGGLKIAEARVNYYKDPNTPEEKPDGSLYKETESLGIQFDLSSGKDAFSEKSGAEGIFPTVNLAYLEPNKDITYFYDIVSGQSIKSMQFFDDPNMGHIVDIAGDIFRLEYKKGRQIGSSLLGAIQYWELIDIYWLINDYLKVLNSLDYGRFVLNLNISQYFNVWKWNDDEWQTVTDPVAINGIRLDVVIEKYQKGLIKAHQSLFDSVKYDTNYDFYGTGETGYWSSDLIFELSEPYFDFIPYPEGGSDKLFLIRLKMDIFIFFSQFDELIFDVRLDLFASYVNEKERVIYGFADDVFRGLKIRKLTIQLFTITSWDLHVANIEDLNGVEINKGNFVRFVEGL